MMSNILIRSISISAEVNMHYELLCAVGVNTSRPPERSPTAHWAKRAYTYHHHLLAVVE